MSDTTAMIEVTATMLPSTVISDRSFALQIASSAMAADSRNLFIPRAGRAGGAGTAGRLQGDPEPNPPAPPALPARPALPPLGVVDLDHVPIRHSADGVVGADDDLVAVLQAAEHLEV